jgi:hypothetical protein
MCDLWAEKPADFAPPGIGRTTDSYNFVETKGWSYEGVGRHFLIALLSRQWDTGGLQACCLTSRFMGSVSIT